MIECYKCDECLIKTECDIVDDLTHDCIYELHKMLVKIYNKGVAYGTLENRIENQIKEKPMIKFERISNNITCDITLPKRATKGSAGYDFYIPYDVTINPHETTIIRTGVRCLMPSDTVLLLVPRSSLGFKYKLQLDNTVGVIDSDYYYSDNEGHIMASITNHSDKTLTLKAGDRFMQGIFVKYCTVDNDDTTETRNGGMGSTDRK